MAKTIYAVDLPPSFLAGWASRLALFSVVLLLATAFLHRLFALPTAIALNVAAGVFAAAAVSLVMALIAGLDVWLTGRQGAPRVIMASFLSLGLLAIPATIWAISSNWPQINDITTDVAEPPEFVEAARHRSVGANPIAYPGQAFATQQQSRYPDLKTLAVPRPVDDAFEIVLQALAKLRYKTSFETPPDSETGAPGTIELTDYTLVLGFADDIVIRVVATDDGANIDLRSASRYGRTDFGRNAERLRLMLKEIVARLEASVPNPSSAKTPAIKKNGKPNLKRPTERDRPSAADRRRRRLSQPGTRRAPEPIE